jgi:hypothetical protein
VNTQEYVRSVEAQIIGRLFTIDGFLHFVLDVNPDTGMARCSRSENGRRASVVEIPVPEVRLWLMRHLEAQEAELAGE